MANNFKTWKLTKGGEDISKSYYTGDASWDTQHDEVRSKEITEYCAICEGMGPVTQYKCKCGRTNDKQKPSED